MLCPSERSQQLFQGQGEVGEPLQPSVCPPWGASSRGLSRSLSSVPLGREEFPFCGQVFVNHLLSLIVLPAEKGSLEGARAPGAEQG